MFCHQTGCWDGGQRCPSWTSLTRLHQHNQSNRSSRFNTTVYFHNHNQSNRFSRLFCFATDMMVVCLPGQHGKTGPRESWEMILEINRDMKKVKASSGVSSLSCHHWRAGDCKSVVRVLSATLHHYYIIQFSYLLIVRPQWRGRWHEVGWRGFPSTLPARRHSPTGRGVPQWLALHPDHL